MYRNHLFLDYGHRYYSLLPLQSAPHELAHWGQKAWILAEKSLLWNLFGTLIPATMSSQAFYEALRQFGAQLGSLDHEFGYQGSNLTLTRCELTSSWNPVTGRFPQGGCKTVAALLRRREKKQNLRKRLVQRWAALPTALPTSRLPA